MPITINLLEEEQQQAVARRHDPTKVVVRIGVFLVVVLLLANTGLWFWGSRKDIERQRAAAEWAKVEKDARILGLARAERDGLHNRLGAYYNYTASRFLWGSELNLIRSLVPPEVYLTEIRGRTEFHTQPRPASAPARAASDAEGTGPSRAAPVRDIDVEVREIILRGRVRGERFIDVLQQFLRRLRTDPEFSKQFADPEADISILDEPQQIPGLTIKEAMFGIRCKLKPHSFD